MINVSRQVVSVENLVERDVETLTLTEVRTKTPVD